MTAVDYDNYDDDVGLGAEDRAHARSSGLEWFKAEKGRTYRVALVYFYPTQFAVIQAARKAGATDADIRQAVDKHLAELAEKLGKARDQLSEVDLLDLGRPRFKRAEVHFVSGLGSILSRLGQDGPDADRVWNRLEPARRQFATLLLVYPTNRDGEIDRDRLTEDWKVQPWQFGVGKYAALHRVREALDANGLSIADQDLRLCCTDTRYQKIDIAAAGPAIYRKQEAFQAKVLAAAAKAYDRLKLGRQMSTADLRVQLGAQGTSDMSDLMATV